MVVVEESGLRECIRQQMATMVEEEEDDEEEGAVAMGMVMKIGRAHV